VCGREQKRLVNRGEEVLEACARGQGNSAGKGRFEISSPALGTRVVGGGGGGGGEQTLQTNEDRKKTNMMILLIKGPHRGEP